MEVIDKPRVSAASFDNCCDNIAFNLSLESRDTLSVAVLIQFRVDSSADRNPPESAQPMFPESVRRLNQRWTVKAPS